MLTYAAATKDLFHSVIDVAFNMRASADEDREITENSFLSCKLHFYWWLLRSSSTVEDTEVIESSNADDEDTEAIEFADEVREVIENSSSLADSSTLSHNLANLLLISSGSQECPGQPQEKNC